jgi:DNA gyrase inhibitor GyrI
LPRYIKAATDVYWVVCAIVVHAQAKVLIGESWMQLYRRLAQAQAAAPANAPTVETCC